jgi:hypothetical protein
MLKKLFAAAALLLSLQSQATVITVELNKNQYEVGETVTAQLWLSDIHTLVTGFNTSLLFNDQLLQLQSVLFGEFLSLPAVGSDQGNQPNAGQLDLWELFFGFSTEDMDELRAAQPGNKFLLASISFITLKNGLSELSTRNSEVLYEPLVGNPYSDIEVRSSGAFVQTGNPALVSAPATAWLMLPALLLMLRLRRN